MPQTTASAVTTSYEREETESSVEERRLDNIIYGNDETDNSDHQDQQSLLNHDQA